MEGSHPLWVRGLKYEEQIVVSAALKVAPFVGAWIEMIKNGAI